MVVNTSDNRYGVAQLIVAPTLAEGANYTTIASALTAASSGQTIFIRPGTYTENITLKAGVDLTSFSHEGDTPNVTISGTMTATFAGTCTIQGIRLQTNAAAFLSITGSSATIVNIFNCYLNCTDTTGISLNNVNCQVYISACRGDIGTTGITLHTITNCAAFNVRYSMFTNTGSSTTASTIATGGYVLYASSISHPTTTSSTANVSWAESDITQPGNTTCLTTAGTATTNFVKRCTFNSGSASAISVGSGTTIGLVQNQIGSSNTNAVTGAGTVNFAANAFTNSSVLNVTTQTAYSALQGNPNSTVPAPGFIGERISSSVLIGSPTTLSNTTTKTIFTVSLTPGIWDITMLVGFFGATTRTVMEAMISTATNALTGKVDGDNYVQSQSFTVTQNQYLQVPAWRVSISATTSYYGVVTSFFTVGTDTAWGRMSAVRVG